MPRSRSQNASLLTKSGCKQCCEVTPATAIKTGSLHWIVGENAPAVRARICEGLEFLGIELDEPQNAANAGVISAAAGRVTVRVMRTDEEQMIARKVCRVLGLG